MAITTQFNVVLRIENDGKVAAEILPCGSAVFDWPELEKIASYQKVPDGELSAWIMVVALLAVRNEGRPGGWLRGLQCDG